MTTKAEAKAQDAWIKEETERKARLEAQDKARQDQAIIAASAVLEPLEFARDEYSQPSKWHPASWTHPSGVRAVLRLQGRGSNRVSGGDDRYEYRLNLEARAIHVRAVRISPGSRDGVVKFLSRAKDAVEAQAAREAKDKKFSEKIEELIVHDFPNLEVVRVDPWGDGVMAYVKSNGTGTKWSILFNREMRFTKLSVSDMDDRTVPLDNVSGALRAL